MHINILHRPETDPVREPVFEMQQKMVHDLGLRATLLATAPSLEDDQSVGLMKCHRERYGDEIGLSFHSLATKAIVDLVGYEEVAVWLYAADDKRKVIRHLVERFREVFGFSPACAAAYHFDASTLQILLEECPSVKTVVAGCFEEGVRVYHGCNNSW